MSDKKQHTEVLKTVEALEPEFDALVADNVTRLTAVNAACVETFYALGRDVHLISTGSCYGEGGVAAFSRKLRESLDNSFGVSVQNLYRASRFFQCVPDAKHVEALSKARATLTSIHALVDADLTDKDRRKVLDEIAAGNKTGGDMRDMIDRMVKAKRLASDDPNTVEGVEDMPARNEDPPVPCRNAVVSLWSEVSHATERLVGSQRIYDDYDGLDTRERKALVVDLEKLRDAAKAMQKPLQETINRVEDMLLG